MCAGALWGTLRAWRAGRASPRRSSSGSPGLPQRRRSSPSWAGEGGGAATPRVPRSLRSPHRSHTHPRRARYVFFCVFVHSGDVARPSRARAGEARRQGRPSWTPFAQHRSAAAARSRVRGDPVLLAPPSQVRARAAPSGIARGQRARGQGDGVGSHQWYGVCWIGRLETRSWRGRLLLACAFEPRPAPRRSEGLLECTSVRRRETVMYLSLTTCCQRAYSKTRVAKSRAWRQRASLIFISTSFRPGPFRCTGSRDA